MTQVGYPAVEMYAQRMSRFEIAHGHRVLDRELSKGGDRASREALLLVVQHYAFAASHLKQGLGQVGEADTIVWQLYNRLKHCRREDIRYLQDEALPTVGQIFNLDTSIVDEALSCALLTIADQAPGEEHLCGSPACDARDCKSPGS